MPSNPHEQELPESQKLPPSEAVLLHQYETIVGLYKHHLDLVLKINIFLYAVTGAIVSFYFSQPNDGLIKYSLVFPAAMNLGYSYFFFISSEKFSFFDIDLKAITSKLNLISCPDIMTVKKMLRLSAWLFLSISLGLFLLTILREESSKHPLNTHSTQEIQRPAKNRANLSSISTSTTSSKK